MAIDGKFLTIGKTCFIAQKPDYPDYNLKTYKNHGVGSIGFPEQSYNKERPGDKNVYEWCENTFTERSAEQCDLGPA